MSIALLIPSHNRPHKLKSLVDSISKNTLSPFTIYFVVSDEESGRILDELGIKYWMSDKEDLHNYVHKINFLFKKSSEDYVFSGADDILFTKGWDLRAIDHIKNGAKVVSTEDLLNPIGSNLLILREYIINDGTVNDLKGVFFHPTYCHNWGYDEVRYTAMKRGVYVHAEDSIVEHLHYTNGKSADDKTYGDNRSSNQKDKDNFESRRHLWM